MKKTYISPSMLVIRLTMTRPLAASTPGVGLQSGASEVDGATLDAKSVSDVNVWDDEW